MARKRASEPTQGSPEVSPQQGISLLKTLIDKAQTLLASRPLTSDEYGAWELLARNYLEKTFGANSPNISSIIDVGKFGAFQIGAGEAYWESHRAESLNTQVRQLAGLIELLETEVQLSSESAVTPVEPPATAHRIFLVHGHDNAVLHETARLLEKLGQEFVILREQPSQGLTIIEKFESYADVGFAIVLLTGDDRGGSASDAPELHCLRARQNVILELGYFLGKLGRSRVCALYQQGVEIPSDYTGVLYVELDNRGAWRWELAKELKAAGFPVDMNRAL